MCAHAQVRPFACGGLEVFFSIFLLCILGPGLSLNLELVDCYRGQAASARGPAVSTSPALALQVHLPAWLFLLHGF